MAPSAASAAGAAAVALACCAGASLRSAEPEPEPAAPAPAAAAPVTLAAAPAPAAPAAAAPAAPDRAAAPRATKALTKKQRRAAAAAAAAVASDVPLNRKGQPMGKATPSGGSVACGGCSDLFASRNALFRHIRATGCGGEQVRREERYVVLYGYVGTSYFGSQRNALEDEARNPTLEGALVRL